MAANGVNGTNGINSSNGINGSNGMNGVNGVNGMHHTRPPTFPLAYTSRRKPRRSASTPRAQKATFAEASSTDGLWSFASSRVQFIPVSFEDLQNLTVLFLIY